VIRHRVEGHIAFVQAEGVAAFLEKRKPAWKND
jgi:hypothetical protein